jgi:hypothetical protein
VIGLLLLGLAGAAEPDLVADSSVVALEARIAALEDEVATLRAGHGAAFIGGTVVVPAGTRVDEAVGLGGPVDVYGTVSGDVVALGDDIRIHPGGSVEGDAVALGGRVSVDEAAVVAGNRVSFGRRMFGSVANLVDTTAVPLLEGLARRLALILSFAAAGVLVVGMWPGRVNAVVESMRRRPFWHAFSGGVLSVVLFVATLLFTVTVIGIPVAILLASILIVAWGLGFVAVCQSAGDRLPGLQGRGAWPAFLVGTTLLAIVGMFPYVGPVVLVLLALPAAGAALTTRLGADGS